MTDPSAAANWQAMAEPDRLAVSRVFANIGKAIAAFERTIQPQATRFDTYADSLASGVATEALIEDEVAGLQLFIGKGECVNCHNGPLFSDTHFHNTGVGPAPGADPDVGRQAGALVVRGDPFNCLGPFSDAASDECAELRFMATGGPEELGAFKTPSLRGAASPPPICTQARSPRLMPSCGTTMPHQRPGSTIPNSAHRDCATLNWASLRPFWARWSR